jgi:hypothetical protein
LQFDICNLQFEMKTALKVRVPLLPGDCKMQIAKCKLQIGVLLAVTLSSSLTANAQNGAQKDSCHQPPAGDAAPVIVNGQVTNDFPAVGLFHTRIREKPATATLIGRRTVLTAAHCIDEGFDHKIELGGKLYEMESAVRHPEFVVNNGDLTRMDPLDRADHDLAIVRLKEAPPIAPAILNTTRLARGQTLVIIGLGETVLNKNDRGTKRQANNLIDRVTPNKFEFRGPQSVCHGDSGGPTFVQVQGQMLLAGVHSVVSNPCGRFGVDMRVDFYLDWIRQTAGDDVILGPAETAR